MTVNNIKTRAVKNKDIMIKLCSKGLELLNVTKDKINGRPCYIFEDTEQFREHFEELIKERGYNYLTDIEKKLIVETLSLKCDELNRLGIKTDSFDTIISKLEYKDADERIKNLSESPVSDNFMDGVSYR